MPNQKLYNRNNTQQQYIAIKKEKLQQQTQKDRK